MLEPKQADAQKSADDGTDQAVSAIEPGIIHIASHSKNRPNAGESGIAPGKHIDKRHKRGRQSGFYASLAHPRDFGVDGTMIFPHVK